MHMSKQFGELAEKVDALQLVFSGQLSLVLLNSILIFLWNTQIGIYLVIIAGGLLSVIGFFGCYGALRENKCFLIVVSMHGTRCVKDFSFL